MAGAINSQIGNANNQKVNNNIVEAQDVVGSGEIMPGAIWIGVINLGAANGMFDGAPVVPGMVVSYPETRKGSYDLIAYDGSGTTLQIRVCR